MRLCYIMLNETKLKARESSLVTSGYHVTEKSAAGAYVIRAWPRIGGVSNHCEKGKACYRETYSTLSDSLIFKKK
jgi:hypothetical protein